MIFLIMINDDTDKEEFILFAQFITSQPVDKDTTENIAINS